MVSRTHGSLVGVAGGRIHGPNTARVACQQSVVAVWVTEWIHQSTKERVSDNGLCH